MKTFPSSDGVVKTDEVKVMHTTFYRLLLPPDETIFISLRVFLCCSLSEAVMLMNFVV